MCRQWKAHRRRDAAGEVERSHEGRRGVYRRLSRQGQASVLAARRKPVIRRWR